MMIATDLRPAGLALKPATLVTIRGEQFALCRPHDPRLVPPGATVTTPPADKRWGWELVDIETGTVVGSGPTKAEAIAYVERRLGGLNPGSLERAREEVLARQYWGLQ
jgi:hypothetical protein